MERRTFLTGAVVAAALPVSAVANKTESGNPSGVSSIRALVEEHRIAVVEARIATAIEDAIYNGGGHPELPFVARAEFHGRHHPLKFEYYTSLDQIDGVFERYDARRALNFRLATTTPDSRPDFKPNPRSAERHAEAVRASAEEREKLHALYSERRAVYEAWSVASGHRDAEARSTTAWDRVNDLDSEIIDFRCVTLEDVRVQAKHIVDEYGDDFSQQAAAKFIAGIAAIGGSVA